MAASWSTPHYWTLSQWLGPGLGIPQVGSPPLFVTETMSLIRRWNQGGITGQLHLQREEEMGRRNEGATPHLHDTLNSTKHFTM